LVNAANALEALNSEFGRWHVAQSAMGAVVVVVMSPVVDDRAHVAQTGEPVLRQAFIPEATLEAFDVGVLHRLAGLDEA
jgi:hypothetical protein